MRGPCGPCLWDRPGLLVADRNRPGLPKRGGISRATPTVRPERRRRAEGTMARCGFARRDPGRRLVFFTPEDPAPPRSAEPAAEEQARHKPGRRSRAAVVPEPAVVPERAGSHERRQFPSQKQFRAAAAGDEPAALRLPNYGDLTVAYAPRTTAHLGLGQVRVCWTTRGATRAGCLSMSSAGSPSWRSGEVLNPTSCRWSRAEIRSTSARDAAVGSGSAAREGLGRWADCGAEPARKHRVRPARPGRRPTG